MASHYGVPLQYIFFRDASNGILSVTQKALTGGSDATGYATIIGDWSTANLLYEKCLYGQVCSHASDCATYNGETMYCVDAGGNSANGSNEFALSTGGMCLPDLETCMHVN